MDTLNTSTSQAIQAQSTALAQAIVEIQYGLQPGTWQTFGASSSQKSIRDAGYHLAYLSEAIANDAPVLFTDYLVWVKALFAGLNFPPDTLAKTLQATQIVIHQDLAPEMVTLVDEYLAAGINRLSEAPAVPPLFTLQNLPLGGLAKEYLDALLKGERQIASQLIMSAVARGISVKDIYLHVFQRTQYEIGRLWQINQISVAQEHFCSAATQMIMSQLYPHIFSTERVKRSMVATCVGSELHEIGMRMVADFFEMAGWDTYYLGANTPAQAVLRAIEERRAHVLGISATLTFHISQVADLIAQVRATEGGKNVKILVGGYPFNISETLWKSVNADGYGRDAQHAVLVANQLVDL
jgi:methylmalonyl-CoA mutase cobalamin-binding domain/chain